MIQRRHCIVAAELGRTRYAAGWEIQRQLFERRRRGEVADTLLLTEHAHVYTSGRNSDADHLLASERELAAASVDVHDIDRGGDVTYHGPGQLVGYPILKLDDYYEDVHRYVRELEEVLMLALGDFSIEGRREKGMTGVWVGDEKIAAIGIKVSHWITMHGFALNVNTDLRYFDRIIPCGIFHKGVTSMERQRGMLMDMEKIRDAVIRRFGEVFDAEMETRPAVAAPAGEEAPCLP